tara:strand:- start:40892 stop:45061 length:4170 start_codon:yes stop_codon:yes gene_type:complete
MRSRKWKPSVCRLPDPERERVRFHSVVLLFLLFLICTARPLQAEPPLAASKPVAESQPSPQTDVGIQRLAFIGLHGGIFEILKRYEEDYRLQLDYFTDEQLASGTVNFSPYRIVFFQHVRGEDRDLYRKLITAGRKHNPKLQIISISGLAEKDLPLLTQQGIIENDEALKSYYGSSPENLRRFLQYVNIKYLNQPGTILPPESVERLTGLFHPDHEGMLKNTNAFLAWRQAQGQETENIPRVVIAVHSTHLAFQQPKVVEALIRQFEKKGVLAVAMIDGSPDYETNILQFKPDAVVHTCHSRESPQFREKLGVPHLHSMFFRKQSIKEWQDSLEGIAANELALHVISQELLGAIEPQIGSGTLHGGGSPEAFSPIEDRIDHLADRTIGWTKLARTPNAEKKIAVIYYDREMGKAELMRGSATGMFMNGPRSLINVLNRMKADGYSLSRVPQDEDELIELMQNQGRQIGVWAPGVLDRLARSGNAVLIPVAAYKKWLEEKVPQPQRDAIIKHWGPPPGNFLVWEDVGEKFIVVPRIDLGNVILLPQPLRGEAHDTSLVHNKLVPPPHNYLATYFWLQEAFAADAMVHFGTHGTEFILPGKAVGLSRADWSDMIMGAIPNINPWIINNLGESSPVRRRAYATLINHLVPPSVNAELSDELLNLHNDIDKWVMLEEGALKEKFRTSITDQFLKANLNQDLRLPLAKNQLLTPAEIERVLEYMHNIHNETTPVSLHILGEAPPRNLLRPWIVTCLGKRFRDALNEVVEVPPAEALNPGDKQKYLRKKSEEIVTLLLDQGFSPEEAVQSVVEKPLPAALPEKVTKGLALALTLNEAFTHTHNEVDNLLAALNGKYIPPGPGNSPDRNPAVVPTGRNMYLVNPEEVPSRPSWQIGKQLVDQLLAQHLKDKGHYPEKIAFTLNSFATFQDYGVMEAQILYLMGVEPIWDERNLVADLKLIPTAELGRPRVDVFISALGYYRDMLPTRMRLIDKAIRLVASQNEPDNILYKNSQQVKVELEQQGVKPEKAERLSRARIFGSPPGQFGSAGYYYLVERSGEWDTREELMNTYLSFSRHVYTDGIWGEDAPETYNRQIQGTEVLIRSWSDRTRSPLSNKYNWYKGGSLSLAIKHLTGKEPEWFFSDVRDPDQASMVNAEDALRKDYRVRLFNRKWIEGMMKEGYAGADQIAVHVSNTMGWKIMRENSVTDETWEEIVDTYIRDKRNLNIREWFESENPFAYQEVTEILLESARKDYWKPSPETLLEVATEYAKSVARHGEGGGLRGGGNKKLEAFVEKVLSAPGSKELDSLLAAWQKKSQESITPQEPTANQRAQAEENTEQQVTQTEQVEGKELMPAEQEQPQPAAPAEYMPWVLLLILTCGVLVGIGFWAGRGIPSR